MSKWTYTVLNIIFFVPVICFAWIKYKRVILKEKKLLVIAGILGFVAFFIVDPIATAWQAWQWDYSQTLNILIGQSTLETIIWAMLVFMAVALAVAVGAEREEKRQKFKISDMFKRSP